jgi:flagellin
VEAAWIKGDLTINGVDIFDPNISTTSFSGKLEAINRFSNETGVTANAYFEKRLNLSATTFTQGEKFFINGESVSLGANDDTAVELATLINTITAETGITASADGTNLVLSGNNVQSINVKATAADGIAAPVASVPPANQYGLGATPATQQTFMGAIRLDSTSNTPISIALGGITAAADHEARHGLLEANVGAADFDTNSPTLSAIFGSAVASLNVLSVDSSSKAIGIADRALQQVSNLRSELGAVENRLEKTVNNLSNIVTNTAQSRSRIKDTDYAVETTNLAKAQIIQQAATAMLAQANQQPQSVLALLQ